MQLATGCMFAAPVPRRHRRAETVKPVGERFFWGAWKESVAGLKGDVRPWVVPVVCNAPLGPDGSLFRRGLSGARMRV